jgi:cobalt/nickel transport system permease protein
MHIPNGFLTDPVCTACTLSSATALGAGLLRLRSMNGSAAGTNGLGSSNSLMAATGAGVFAAQMVNYPIEAGTSGHLLGAALAAIVLGPWRGMITMAIVITAQCVLFGDGGTQALGANILNMAVVGTLVASGLYHFVTRYVGGTSGKLAGAAAASFGSVLAAAALCSVELTASGTYNFTDLLAAMLGVHALIGICEAAITMSVLALAHAAQRQLRGTSARRFAVGGLALAIVIAGVLAPLASTAPDGLERVADDFQIATLATAADWSMAPDYSLPGITWPTLAVALAGIVGVAFVFAATYTLGRTATVKVRKR